MTEINDHVFYSWSAQDQIDPVEIVDTQGATITDATGNTFIDFTSQLVFTNLGHQHPRLIQAIKDQADHLTVIAPAYKNATRSELARRIAEAAPGDLNYVFFTNSGAEANEHAVRMARFHTGRKKVLSAYRSYHGATATAMTLTGEPRRWANDNLDAHVGRFFGPYSYRSPFHSDSPEQETERALEHLEQSIILEGADTIAAIILETVVGTNGVLVPPPGYLEGLRALCDKYGIMWIADEVMVGFGRTGTMFAVENFGATPDLLTFAKGVNSGYVPLGGVVMTTNVRDTFADRPYPGGLTYSGHPLACAAGVETFKIFEDEKVLENVADLSEHVLKPTLAELAEKHDLIGDVRGLGMFWALELVKDRKTKEPLVPFAAKGEDNAPMAAIGAACKKAGLLAIIGGNRIQIAPPLTITEEELRRGLDAIDAALGEAREHYTG
jgi:taurine--2-oxoglutarate transaminase